MIMMEPKIKLNYKKYFCTPFQISNFKQYLIDEPITPYPEIVNSKP